MNAARTSHEGPSVPVRTFAVQAGAVLFVFTVFVFIGIYWRVTTLIEQGVQSQASSYADLIVDTREWNASHGGVWVVKTATSPSNPYLRALGVEPDTSTVSGTQLTLRNPAAMTNEISRITARQDLVTFRLTSLKPVNPADAPDAWERQQLDRFPTDPSQVSQIERIGSRRVLRLMRPLVTEGSCLKCHATQGYHVGDIRGAISVVVPLASADSAVAATLRALLGIFALVVVVGGAIGYTLVRRMAGRIDDSEELLRAAATTDALTGAANRRAIFERLDEELVRAKRESTDLGVVIMDADLFKDVNDSHGHAAGDAVLRELTARLSSQLREYDRLGRIGGEEFLVIAPSTRADALAGLAERLRAAVAAVPIRHEGVEISLSVSAGTAVARAEDTPDSLVARADIALYRAKAAGRNRIEAG